MEELKRKYQEQLEINRAAQESLTKEYSNKAQVIEEPWKDKTHLINLNEDPLLSGKIHYVFHDGKNVIGRPDPDSDPDFKIGGAGVQRNHCEIDYDGSKAVILPNDDPNNAKVYVNGELVKDVVTLSHNDRILFGSHNFFLYKEASKPEDPSINWEFANNEAVKDQVKAMTSEQEKILQAKIKEMEEKFEEEKKKMEEEAKAKIEEQVKAMEERKAAVRSQYEARIQELREKGGSEDEIRELEEEMRKLDEEQDESIKAAEEGIHKQTDEFIKKQEAMRVQAEYRLRNQKELEEQLSRVIPRINDANDMCFQLGKLNYIYMPTIVTDVQGNQFKSNICVKIFPDHHNQDVYNQVDMNEFMERYYMIQEKYQNQQYDLDHGVVPNEPNDPTEDLNVYGVEIKYDWRLIGKAHVYTDTFANLLDIQNDLTPLIDNKGKISGNSQYKFR